MEVFSDLFYGLPCEMRLTIYSFLDPCSRLCLRIGLLGYKAKREDFTHDLCNHIVGNGLSVTFYFWSFLPRERLFSIAAKTGSIDVFRFLDEVDHRRTAHFSRIPYIAALNGHLPLVEYLLERGWDGDYVKEMFMGAAKNGHLSLVKYLWPLFKTERELDATTMADIVSGGSIPVVSFLHSQGIPFTLLETLATTRSNSVNGLNILKYLRENNCPWNENIVKNASFYGNMEIIQYAIENVGL